ncbi:lysis protein [Vibrio fluvialis]|uniref:lysis protein n=1 Tax=Vibrio fluvialis TaxID=676 RepID=UPI001F3AB451|nr:lysis protein [Vibrio fluvialis]MCE7612002.1 lysis protein [Vibrio fluvialis]MCE7621581.1 lysis protein [Vibrio fluvialis]MCE7627841.1 lysis protein [Vibrio fluvialis]
MPTAAYWKVIVIGVIAAIIASLSGLFAIERERRQSAELELNQVVAQRNSLIELNNKQIAQIKTYNELGIKHAAELSAAQEEIDRLGASLRSANVRLRVKAVCPASMPFTASARSMGDEVSPRLTEAAQQDYLRLQRMMAENLQQTKYLQDYIREQCLVD